MKPRNPTVIPMLRKKAGSHRKSYKAQRVKDKSNLKKEGWYD